jgi:CRP/FNR family transcriptional regulator, cyclic AMP receptor protein
MLTLMRGGTMMVAGMHKNVIKGYLKAVPMFSDLTVEELDMLASASRVVTAKKNARLFEEGAVADYCFVLIAGRARVVISADNGTEILLSIVKPTSLVGEVALLDRSTRSASLVAAENCRFIRIQATAFAILRRNPRFEDRIVVGLVSILREVDDQVRVIATYPSVSRVAWCLGRIARQEGRRDGTSIVIPKARNQELAEITGCTRETVSRALSTLKRKKYVSWDRSTMRLEMESMQRFLRLELSV